MTPKCIKLALSGGRDRVRWPPPLAALLVPLAVEPAASVTHPGAAGSLVLRRMDRRGPCAGKEARHQERHRRPAPAGLSQRENGLRIDESLIRLRTF